MSVEKYKLPSLQDKIEAQAEEARKRLGAEVKEKKVKKPKKVELGGVKKRKKK